MGGAGNDTLDGGIGNDVFVFQDGDGDDRIWFVPSTDVMDLSAVTNIVGFNDLMANHVVPYEDDHSVYDVFTEGIFINYDTNSIRVVNVDVDDLSSGSFIF